MRNNTLKRKSRIVPTKGFTLVELLTTVSIAAILTAIAIPNLRQFQLNSALKTHITRVFQTTQASREAALGQASNILICATSDLNSCIGSGAGKLMVFADINRSGAREDNEPLIFQYEAPTQLSLHIKTPAHSNKNWLSYRAIGDANPWGSIYLCAARKDLNGLGHQVITSRIGRNRILVDGPKVLEECKQAIK